MRLVSGRSSSRRSHARGSALAAVALLTLLGAALPAATLAADPSAGFDATWTVTRPDGTTIRDDGSISVGDDLDLTLEAVDGTPVTQCRIVIQSGNDVMNVPGKVTAGTCHFAMRLPAFPDPASRAGGARPGTDLCVFLHATFADAADRPLIAADQLEPGGQACGGTDASPTLDFLVDDAGATLGRPFVSDPTILSWDPTDWDTGMTPLQFGQTWHVAFPAFVDFCSTEIVGSWQTGLRALQPATCVDWNVRVPGILPEGVDLGGADAWQAMLAVQYDVAGGVGGPYSVQSSMTVPLKPSDGVFQSNLPAVFPMDLAKSRFVTVDHQWVPSYQVSGTTASICRMLLYDHQGAVAATYEVAPDPDDQCTFHVPALGADEWHQYHVYAIPVSDPNSLEIVFGGSITAIPEPAPPVIEDPTAEAGGNTGLDVEPGVGNGLVVDLQVTPDVALTASSSATLASGPACADRAISANLASGGSIPTLEARCDLAPGAYTATATMVDAAGVASVAHRRFTVPSPRPTIAARSPSGGATGVARDARPSVTFDQGVTGVSTTSMRLAESNGTFVTASVAYDATTHKATLTPSALLKTGRGYRVYLSNAIHAAGTGRALTATSWTFTTTTDATAPTVVGRSPASGATAVARSVIPAARFSEGVKGVSTTSVQLRDTVTGLYVAATVRYDAAQHRAALDPTPTLAAGRTYLVILRSSIRDLAGNPLTTTTWSFTTGS